MAERGRQIFPYIILAIALAATVLGFQNSRLTPEGEALARDHACTVDGACIVQRDRPREMRSDPIRRRYQFDTTVGSVVVTCKREYFFVGKWKCVSEKGVMSGQINY